MSWYGISRKISQRFNSCTPETTKPISISISSTAKHAEQLPENPGKEFLDHLFHLGVLSTTLTVLLLLLMVLLLLLLLLGLVVIILLLLLWLVLLLLLLLTPITLLITIPSIDILHIHITTAEIDINAPLILFSMILQAQFATDLLDARLDLLHMADTMIPAADNHMKMRLAVRLGVADALLEDVLGLLDKLAVQVDRVGRHAPVGVVLAEDKLRRLLVVLFHLGPVPFAFLGERVRRRPIALLVRLLRLGQRRRPLPGLFAREVAQSVVFLFGGLRLIVVEC